MKRIFDLIVSTFLFFIFIPLMALLAVLIRSKIGSPILFIQERPGLHMKTFKLYKFRTMTNKKDSNGELLPDSDRLLNFGKFLRKYSLDELPQLWNVIRGDISLVGPRPLLVEYLPLYTVEQQKRHEVKPGITGWAQINGRNAITWEEKLQLDVWYVKNHTLWLDFKILVMTIKKVIQSEGITQSNHVTIEKFIGSEKKEGM